MTLFRPKQRQELYCHGCDTYIQFVMDLRNDGNHVLTCKKCGHEHCRVVKDGKITDIRWDQRNGSTLRVATMTNTINPVYYQAVSTATQYINSQYIINCASTAGGT
jgi:hypothetical protein